MAIAEQRARRGIQRTWEALPLIGMCLWIIPERTFITRASVSLLGVPMKRSRADSVASVLLRKVRSAYEYPGHLVLADIARLQKTIKRAYYAATRSV